MGPQRCVFQACKCRTCDTRTRLTRREAQGSVLGAEQPCTPHV